MKYYKVMLIKIIKILQNVPPVFYVLAVIVSVILGGIKIYSFIQNQKERRSRLDRGISIKESELEALRQRHRQEYEDLEASYEGEIRVREFSRVDLRTENDRRREARLFDRQRNEESRIWAELGHFYELGDGKSDLLFGESKFRRFWNTVLRIFKRE